MAVVDATSATGNSATPTCPVPTGTASGQIAILALGHDNGTADVEPADIPSGFTELAKVSLTGDGHLTWIGWKRLSGADSGSYVFGNVGTVSDWAVCCVLLSGRHATNPPVVSANGTNNSANASPVTVTANGVTAVDGDDLVAVSVPDIHASGVITGHTPPGGYTEQEDAAANWSGISAATKENVSAGATGSVSFTLTLSSSTSGWEAWLVRVPWDGTTGAGEAAAGPIIGPVQIPSRRVGPQALRQAKHSPVPFDLTQAPATDTNFGTRVLIPNRFVGPMALRQLWRAPVPYDASVLAPVTDTNFAVPARMPNNRVGPPVLRALYRPPTYPFDSTIGAAATGNRRRRVICSSSDA